jgi:hypothetical protein
VRFSETLELPLEFMAPKNGEAANCTGPTSRAGLRKWPTRASPERYHDRFASLPRLWLGPHCARLLRLCAGILPLYSRAMVGAGLRVISHAVIIVGKAAGGSACNTRRSYRPQRFVILLRASDTGPHRIATSGPDRTQSPS